jgi:PadR family transcriptional regulator PadR
MTTVFFVGVGLLLLVGAAESLRHAHQQEQARAALLRALRSGPGYALALIERVKQESDGELDLGDQGYAALRDLEREGLVESWEGEPLPGGKRPRRYYGLRQQRQRAGAA